jgi:paraquat-inducible protein A
MPPATASAVVICARCDTVNRSVTLAPNQMARCGTCAAPIEKGGSFDVDRLLALSVTAAFLFALTASTPVLVVEFAGMQTEANVPSAALSLASGWIWLTAVALAVTMYVVPILQIALLLWVLGFARVGRAAPACRQALVLLHQLRPWSMTEVFLLGALIVVVKLSAWVHVSAGVGLWSMCGLTVVLALLNLQEPKTWWRLLGEDLPRAGQ